MLMSIEMMYICHVGVLTMVTNMVVAPGGDG